MSVSTHLKGRSLDLSGSLTYTSTTINPRKLLFRANGRIDEGEFFDSQQFRMSVYVSRVSRIVTVRDFIVINYDRKTHSSW